MPVPNLQDLNIVHPARDWGDSQDLRLSQAQSDLIAQLNLWTNLAFDCDEPLTLGNEEHKNVPKKFVMEKDNAQFPVARENAIHDGHVNVINPPNIPFNQDPNDSAAVQCGSPFDINALLNSFGIGIDAFAAVPSQLQQQPTTISPSLTQLLALHPVNHQAFGTGLPQHISDAATLPSLAFPTSTPSEELYVPTGKRARTRRVSVTSASADSPDSQGESKSPNPNLSPAEAKRRRNTAASARFRLKKREKEAALENKAKELETLVDKLETERKGLHKEIRWLNGLVIAIAIAAQGSRTCTGLITPSPPVTTETTGSK